MPDCSPQELISDARCWQCYGQENDIYERLEILLLCRIKEGVVMADCDPLALVSDAYCLTCTIPREMWPAVKLALLCSIATGGGGTGTGGAGVVGTGSPESVVTAPPGTTYLDTGPPASFWYKQSGALAVGWIQLIA